MSACRLASPWAGLLAAAMAAATAGFPSAFQDAPPVFRGGVDLVTVPFVVTGRDRRFVTGLTRDDFVVYDGGRRQPIVNFADDSVPVSLGVVLDSSPSMTESRMRLARGAVTALFDKLGFDDEVFLGEFSDAYRSLLTWTTNRTELGRGLNAIRGGNFTALLDAANHAVQVAATGTNPRKALLLISDGDDNASKTTGRAVRQTIRAREVMVYAFGVEATDSPTEINEGELRNLTDDTGGRTEIVRGFENLNETVARFANELSSQYVLAYAPPGGRAGEWREIRVEAPNHRGVTVRARRGYYSQ